MTTLLLAFAAGVLTLLNPCVLPVLPLVLASTLQASRFGPLALALGLGVSFTMLGLSVALLAAGLGISAEDVARAGALALVAFGLFLLLPVAGRGFAFATAGLADRADRGISRLGRAGAGGTGAGGQFLAGLLLGAVWSPCVGPTLGGALALAAQGRDLVQAGGIMVAFVLGTGAVILTLGHAGRALLLRHRARMRRVAEVSKPLTGAIFVLTGAVLLFGLQHYAEGWLIRVLPIWLQNFSVSI